MTATAGRDRLGGHGSSCHDGDSDGDRISATAPAAAVPAAAMEPGTTSLTSRASRPLTGTPSPGPQVAMELLFTGTATVNVRNSN